MAGAFDEVHSPRGSTPATRFQMSTEPTGSAAPYTWSVGCRIAASSASSKVRPGRYEFPLTIARTISRSWRIESVSLPTAVRQSTNSSGMRPSSRLCPCPDWRRIDRIRAGLSGRRTRTAPAGEARSLMILGTPTSETIGPPPISTTRPTRKGYCAARRSAHTLPIEPATTCVRSSSSASRAPRRTSATSVLYSCLEKSSAELSPQPGRSRTIERKPGSSLINDAHAPGPTVPWTKSTGSPDPTSSTRRRAAGASSSRNRS
jgi:hypothetical protein